MVKGKLKMGAKMSEGGSDREPLPPPIAKQAQDES
jgi:hypothetical protein